MPEQVALKQITVFLENRAGRLAAICNALGKAGVNILALSLADTSDFGILRLVLDDPDEGLAALERAGFTVGGNRIIAVEVPDEPGGLGRVLNILEEAKVNVEYLFPFVGAQPGYAPIAFRFDKPEEAVRVLREAGINVEYSGSQDDEGAS